jgi:hypothetical protein
VVWVLMIIAVVALLGAGELHHTRFAQTHYCSQL